ncbi:1-aminocyclopropane-1-carboxylate oxidase 1 [Oryza glaberrima]|uniref:1-aminocyclopropane-1-carboxylate oxidase n=1 Tax=Oryza glaberrima TaxID=4538 RepID=I1Q374_ORYGL|nr:1-aminocyclopropane-1-carboxylate oxidase 1 [Oryza glaberrima]
MEIPVIKMDELHGEKRSETLQLLHDACAQWGFFWLENHGINEDLMYKIKGLVNKQYEQSMEKNFYNSETAKNLGPDNVVSNVDWECSFMYRHQPESNIHDIPELVRTTLPEYAEEVIKLAERLAEVMSENLGLDKDYLKKAFSNPSVGIKAAKYPRCSHPEFVMGLRGHTDAGGIILLLQDDLVPGLEFLKDGRWMPIPPTQGNRIFVNLGDQVEVISNGIYKSICHQVVPNKNGSRLSIATFYNPGPDAIVFPAQKLTYPSQYRFKDYLEFYSTTKFTDKVSRFQTTKMIFK